MVKEIKYFVFLVITFLFLFFTIKYYFSDENKKKSYLSTINIKERLNNYSSNLIILENDTKNIIEYSNDISVKKKKKYSFWDLIKKDE